MDVNLIGVPLFYGSGKKGVDLAPNKLREKGVVDLISKYHNVYDCGNIYVPEINEYCKSSSRKELKYLEPIVQINRNLAEQVYNSLSADNFPFVVGGDHSLGIGSICGASKYFDKLAVIWVDAHGDINTDKTTPSGNIHGMPLAASMGFGTKELTDIYYMDRKISPENVFIIGARDLDEGEINLIENTDIHLYSTEDVKEKGIEAILEEIHSILIKNKIEAVHLSFDIDCIDSKYVPGTGTPVSNGMSVEQSKYVIKYLMKTKLAKSMDLVELNTLLDKGEKTTDLVLDLIDCTFKSM